MFLATTGIKKTLHRYKPITAYPFEFALKCLYYRPVLSLKQDRDDRI